MLPYPVNNCFGHVLWSAEWHKKARGQHWHSTMGLSFRVLSWPFVTTCPEAYAGQSLSTFLFVFETPCFPCRTCVCVCVFVGKALDYYYNDFVVSIKSKSNMLLPSILFIDFNCILLLLGIKSAVTSLYMRFLYENLEDEDLLNYCHYHTI